MDDEVDAADSLVALLKSLGYDACASYEGQEAVLLAELMRPSLVILDLGMPGMDGYETAASIRGTEAGGPAYLVALTGHDHDLDRTLAACFGFDLFVSKPVSATLLKDLASAAYH